MAWSYSIRKDLLGGRAVLDAGRTNVDLEVFHGLNQVVVVQGQDRHPCVPESNP